MATLEDLEDLLSSMNKSISEQNGFLKSIFELQNKNADEERRRREREQADRSRVPAPSPGTSGPFRGGSGIISDSGLSAGQSFIGAFLGASGILSSIQGLAAGATALGLALTGFTGWEADIIKSVGGGLKSLTGIVSSGIVRLRNSILTRFFGFTADGAVIRDPITGRFGRGPSIADQITERISKLRTSALAIFGLGPDGRPLMTREPVTGRFSGVSIVGKISAAISRILSPLRTVAEGIAGFITGSGRGLWNFISPYIGKVGAFAGLVGKILKPIGILFSAYEGITAFMGKEGTLFEKFGAGISTFIADFVGVPFDLIKNGMLWIVKKFFPGLTSPDGSFDESTITGRILQLASDFSIADTIKYLVEAPFKLIANVSNWIADKITWVSSEAEKLGDTFKQKIDQMKDKLTSLPDRARLIAENMINDASEKLKIGFLNLGNWIATIPRRIKLMALETLKFATSGLPIWAQIVSDQDITDAKRDVETGNPNIQDRVSEIRSAADAERGRISAELEMLRSGSGTSQNTLIINSPNNSTTQYNTQGGSSSSVVNAVGGNGGSDLDRMSMPGGVQ